MILLWKGTSAPVVSHLKGQGEIPPSFHRSPASLKLPMMLLCKGICAPVDIPFQRARGSASAMHPRSGVPWCQIVGHTPLTRSIGTQATWKIAANMHRVMGMLHILKFYYLQLLLRIVGNTSIYFEVLLTTESYFKA